ncbi:hypothetical protein BH24GEM3_BH24GEM3_08600 [soil metagenome]
MVLWTQTRPGGGWVWVDSLPAPPPVVRETVRESSSVAGQLFNWPPLLWTVRVLVLIFLLVLVIALLVGVFRLVTGRMPVTKAGATLKGLGAEASVTAEFASEQNTLNQVHDLRVTRLEDQVKRLVEAGKLVDEKLSRQEAQRVNDLGTAERGHAGPQGGGGTA